MATPIEIPLYAYKESPSQTAGPYVHIGLTPNFCGIEGVYDIDLGSRMLTGRTQGERIALELRVIDGAGTPLKDALIEIWQADTNGRYPGAEDPRGEPDPEFGGWGRAPADADTGLARFETIKPGPVPFTANRMQAPHINLWIVARGINIGLSTRLYFDDEPVANADDPVLARIEHRDRVRTLIAKRDGDIYRHDIHLQGPQETVFFDI
jgi:protocatechuate 3,4-dioxygenase alpha subunit